jgi:hypothetical protein
MDSTAKELVNVLIYQIKIYGLLKEKWIDWLNGMVGDIKGEEGANCTTITVAVPDQAALRGIMNKLWDLNLTLISAIRMEVKRG